MGAHGRLTAQVHRTRTPSSTDGDGTFVLHYQLSGMHADGSTYEGQLGQYLVSVLDESETVVASRNLGDALGFFSCALTSSGGVKCWGRNNEAQLGNGEVTQTVPQGIPTPVDVIGLSTGVVQVSAGVFTTCAVLATGGAKWASGANGQMGNGTVLGTNTPGDVQGLTDAVQISVGSTHACAVTAGGGVKCWGAGDGVIGTGINIPHLTPADGERTIGAASDR